MHVEALHRAGLRETTGARHFATRSGQSWMRKAIAAARAATFVSLGAAVLLTATCSQPPAEPINVSVRDVVIDPYAVDGKLVRLYGLLHHTADGDALYWHEADIQQSIASHAVGVHYSSPPAAEVERDGMHVAMEGIFYAAKPPRRGRSSKMRAMDERYNGALVGARRVHVR